MGNCLQPSFGIAQFFSTHLDGGEKEKREIRKQKMLQCLAILLLKWFGDREIRVYSGQVRRSVLGGDIM